MKPKLGLEPMFSGLLMGFAAMGFAACLLLVLNGKAKEWFHSWRDPVRTPSVGAPSIQNLLPGEVIRPSTSGSHAPAPVIPNPAAH